MDETDLVEGVQEGDGDLRYTDMTNTNTVHLADYTRLVRAGEDMQVRLAEQTVPVAATSGAPRLRPRPGPPSRPAPLHNEEGGSS